VTRLVTAAGRALFGLALIGFGLSQFVVWDFVPGRAPAFVAAPVVRAMWVIVSGALFVAAGLAIITGKRAIRFALATAALIAVWALLRHLPLVAVDRSIGVEWTNTGKALALTGGALAIAGSFLDRRRDVLFAIGRSCLGAFMILAGIHTFCLRASFSNWCRRGFQRGCSGPTSPASR